MTSISNSLQPTSPFLTDRAICQREYPWRKMHSVVDCTFSGLRTQQVFSPSAALFAAVAPWLLLGSLYGWFQPLVDVAIHARGMLFGYVGALIAGYLGGKLAASQMAALFGSWLAGRILELCTNEPLIVNLVYAAFCLYLTIIVVP
ncbi:MAG: NnrS family protein [Pseudomonadales bacterium]|nr:NnrS family protein [Pseudomonadales bacterium]